MKPEIISAPITQDKFLEHVKTIYGDMAKVVVDLSRKSMTIGGNLHADGEALLLAQGSRQEDLWGANVYVNEIVFGERIEYTSLINIRPRQGNRSMELQDPELRKQVRAVVDTLIPL